MDYLDQIKNPKQVFSCEQILVKKDCPIDKIPGVYAWYFKEAKDLSKIRECCYTYNNLTLLYVGISPSKPPQNGEPSKANLRTRIKTHFRGNVSGSTLRFSLACLLGFEFSLTKSGRFSIGEKEKELNKWMCKNAFVTWIEHSEPWTIESQLIRNLSLPLNLEGNKNHYHHAKLTELRSRARQNAREEAQTK